MTFRRNSSGLQPAPAASRPAMFARRGGVGAIVLSAVVLFAAGCRQDMHDTPRYTAYQASDQSANGASARIAPAGTVARGLLREDEALYTGKMNGETIDRVPFALSHGDLRRGQERYTIYCTPCHGELGDGNGMVVQRGLRQAASYHQDRLREERIGYFFDVITNGFGAMQGYAEQVPVRDRWLIAAYIRALQYSQNTNLEDVPADRRGELSEPNAAPRPEGTPPPASGTGQPAQRPEGTKQ